MIKIAKVALALGMPEASTEKEVDQELNTRIEANEADIDSTAEAADDEGADAGAEDKTEEQAPTVSAAAQDESDAKPDATAAALAAIAATLGKIDTRLRKIEAIEDASDTNGEKDATEVDGSSKKPWMKTAANQEALEMFGKK